MASGAFVHESKLPMTKSARRMKTVPMIEFQMITIIGLFYKEHVEYYIAIIRTVVIINVVVITSIISATEIRIVTVTITVHTAKPNTATIIAVISLFLSFSLPLSLSFLFFFVLYIHISIEKLIKLSKENYPSSSPSSSSSSPSLLLYNTLPVQAYRFAFGTFASSAPPSITEGNWRNALSFSGTMTL